LYTIRVLPKSYVLRAYNEERFHRPTYMSLHLFLDQSPSTPLFFVVVIYAFTHTEQKLTCPIKPETFLMTSQKAKLEIDDDKGYHYIWLIEFVKCLLQFSSVKFVFASTVWKLRHDMCKNIILSADLFGCEAGPWH
jgi:FAD synthase